MREIAAVAGLVYLTLLLTLTFLPFGTTADPGVIEVRLTPFQTIRGALRLGPGSQEFAVLVGNLLAFVPVGMIVPLLVGRRSWLAAIGGGFVLSLGIEIVQWAVSVALGYTYRTADVDDVLVNTLGAAAGYFLFVVLDSLKTLAGSNRPDRPAGR